MKTTAMLGGMGIGLVAGTVLGMNMAPKKKSVQRQAKKTIQAVEDMVTLLGDSLNM